MFLKQDFRSLRSFAIFLQVRTTILLPLAWSNFSLRSQILIVLKIWAGSKILNSSFLSELYSSRRTRGPIGYRVMIRDMGNLTCSLDAIYPNQNDYPLILFSFAFIIFIFTFSYFCSEQLVMWTRMLILLGASKIEMLPISMPFSLQRSYFSLRQDLRNLILNYLDRFQQQGIPSIPSPSYSKICVLLWCCDISMLFSSAGRGNRLPGWLSVELSLSMIFLNQLFQCLSVSLSFEQFLLLWLSCRIYILCLSTLLQSYSNSTLCFQMYRLFFSNYRFYSSERSLCNLYNLCLSFFNCVFSNSFSCLRFFSRFISLLSSDSFTSELYDLSWFYSSYAMLLSTLLSTQICSFKDALSAFKVQIILLLYYPDSIKCLFCQRHFVSFQLQSLSQSLRLCTYSVAESWLWRQFLSLFSKARRQLISYAQFFFLISSEAFFNLRIYYFRAESSLSLLFGLEATNTLGVEFLNFCLLELQLISMYQG